MILNPDNNVHLFCLHYVYIPRINESLGVFCNAWNNHPLSSSSNATPYQLWLTSPRQEDFIAEVYIMHDNYNN